MVRALQIALPAPSRKLVRPLAALALTALAASGCKSRGGPETTGSIGGASLGQSVGQPGIQRVTRADVEALGAKYAADPSDTALAMRYARGLRATEQKTQAVAVLQQAALRNPKDKAVLAAYGKSLAEVGRLAEAADVLQNAHTPAQPDWRVLSTQGSVADQMGDHTRALGFYEAALKIAPDEPTILSNLGMSYVLSHQLDLAESTLRRASAQPGADSRVRQNLAFALGLRGRYDEAEQVLRQDLSAEEAAANVASMRAMGSRPGSKTLKAADKRTLAPDAEPRG